MNKTLIAAAALFAVASCSPPAGSAPAANRDPTVGAVVILSGSPSDEVIKFCDAGRAVYVYDGYRSGGLAVVPNAAECAR